jgi:radical SAM protein with 4Fe4S-binding SPASM domain
MAFETIVTELKQKYSVIDTIYLSDYLKHGNQWLHQQLSNAYRPEYNKQDRILVVQDCADTYDYENFPGAAISTLQKYASQIDISNSFILLVSSNNSIITELEQAQVLYSTDKFSIQSYLIDTPKFIFKQKYSDTFCSLPWMHLYVGPDGNVLPCCQADHDFPMGNIQTSLVVDIVKSDRFNRLRSNMLSGKRSKECSNCYIHEDAGRPSSRMKHNQDWKTVNKDTVKLDGTIDSFEPTYLDIRLNNVCNLKCRMCSGYFSSSIAQEDFEMFGKTLKTPDLMRAQQRTDSLKEILDYVPHAEKIYFAGGEPLLAAEHYEILDKLISSGNTDLEIVYNTNFTNLNYKNQPVTNWWKHFKNISIGASLDAHSEVAGYVRHGTVWATVEKNLDFLKEQCPTVNFTVTSTVGFLTAASLIELQRNWHNTGRVLINKFSFNLLVQPEHLSVAALPVHHKTRLESLIKPHIEWCQKNFANRLAIQWQNVLSYMWSRNDSHHLGEFKRLTLVLDQQRGESFKQVFPEYEDLIDTNS